ncbi:MAG: sigma-70 family RNA polymerase sigma factor [Nitrospinae bacterium]|jgi:RNA polymerase sigma-32 factor|nr:sigma-70 family RNA polymerase sigma factor [Nitrospinota bacterium]MDA1110523.1 sigma-70 family RNA polymerase sigma factor [Nitrospinota bacterium]
MNKETDKDEIEEEPENNRLLPVVRANESLARLDPLTAYLREIRQYEGLSEEEEHALAVKYKKTGDLNAAYRLTTAHLMMVVRIAMTFKREWNTMMDLVQEGNIGLMKAVKNFDPLRGVRLSAYATWWIRSYMLKYILDNWRLVRVGTTNVRRKLLFNLQKEKERLEREGFAPTTKLLAERFGVDEEEVIDVDASLGAADVPMDAPLSAGSTQTPADTLGHDQTPEQHVVSKMFKETLQEKIEAFKEDLKPVEQEILEDRVLSESPLSLQELGDRHGITREAIRQSEQRLLKKFKTYIKKHLPEAAEYFR